MANGLTLRELWEAMQAECGVHERTIRRDMELLSGIGLIHVVERDAKTFYCWNDRSVRGAIFRHMARMQEMIW
ncbi:MAG: hypothetical protein AAGG48_01525 [Planctomycetota bacterium]